MSFKPSADLSCTQVKGAKLGKASVKRKCEPEEVQERKKRYEETRRTIYIFYSD